MASTAKFWDRVADKYYKQPISDEDAYQHKLTKTRDYFTSESRVLEFACGTGATALSHAPFVKEFHAIDLSKRMIELCEQRKKEASVQNVHFEQAAIEDVSAPSDGYDVIMGMSILHLLQDKEAVVAKVHRLLKPGGVFVSSTVCIADVAPFLKPLAPIGKALGLLPHLNSFNKEGLIRCFNVGGFYH